MRLEPIFVNETEAILATGCAKVGVIHKVYVNIFHINARLSNYCIGLVKKFDYRTNTHIQLKKLHKWGVDKKLSSFRAPKRVQYFVRTHIRGLLIFGIFLSNNDKNMLTIDNEIHIIKLTKLRAD